MNISLTPELERFLAEEVQRGRYPTASEVERAGLHLLKEREGARQEKLTELQKEIAIGIEQSNQGKIAPFDAQETLARIRQKKAQISKSC